MLNFYFLQNFMHFIFQQSLHCIRCNRDSFFNKFFSHQQFFFKNRFSYLFSIPYVKQFGFCTSIRGLFLNFSNLNYVGPRLNLMSFSNKDLFQCKIILQVLAKCSIFKFEHLIELTATDLLGKAFVSERNRFQLSYMLSSFLPQLHTKKLQINVACSEFSHVLTISDLFPAANWSEREIWDFFGIRFRNHEDLRRILSDYGFRGFPLRKDFPTVGFKQVRYDELHSSVIYEDLFLMQEEREANFVNPWVSRHVVSSKGKSRRDSGLYAKYLTSMSMYE